MKTTLELPDDLMIEVKIQAARQNRSMKEIVANALRRELGLESPRKRRSVRGIKPVSVGELKELGSNDVLEEMLNARGHRY